MDSHLLRNDTQRILRQGFYRSPTGQTVHMDIATSVSRAQLYTPRQLETLIDHTIWSNQYRTKVEVLMCCSLAAMHRLLCDLHIIDTACVNSPSAEHCGGGMGIEEMICNSSSLYESLRSKKNSFYWENRKSRDGLYTDNAIWSPGVQVFRESTEDRKLLETPYQVNFISIPAPNLQQVAEDRKLDAKLALLRRISYQFAIAADKGQRVLVLGAYGVGDFGNDPCLVANSYKYWLDSRFVGVFERIIFCIPNDDKVRQLFSETFIDQ